MKDGVYKSVINDVSVFEFVTVRGLICEGEGLNKEIMVGIFK